MKKLSTGEWVAVIVALILGVAIFVVDMLLRAPVQTIPDGVVVEDTMPVPGSEGVVETVVNE